MGGYRQGKTYVRGERPVPTLLSPAQVSHRPYPGSNPVLRSSRTVTSRLRPK